MKEPNDTNEFEIFIDYLKYYILSSDHFKQYIKSNIITLYDKNLGIKELKNQIKLEIKKKESKLKRMEVDESNKLIENSSFHSKKSHNSDSSYIFIKYEKKIANCFKSLNEDLDFIEFNKEDYIKMTNITSYFEVVNDLIDSLFMLKGILLENKNTQILLNVSYVLKHVVCKLLLLVLESLILSKLKNT